MAGSRVPNYNYPPASHSGTGVGLPAPTPSIPKPVQAQPAMAAYQTSTTIPTAQSRRKKPDWNEFYKNGVPKEIIVIDDDDDEPTTNNSAQSSVYASSTIKPSSLSSYTNSGVVVPPASKKRRTGVETTYDLAYAEPSYSVVAPQYGEGSSGTSLSTDRTASLHTTTAATSLGSQGVPPTSTVYYDDTAIGQKRKRVVTRKSARDEQKRREQEIVGDAFTSYIPPPHPPLKSRDVYVPVIRDVSCSPWWRFSRLAADATIAKLYKTL